MNTITPSDQKSPEAQPPEKPQITIEDSPSLGKIFESLLKAPITLLFHVKEKPKSLLPLFAITTVSILIFGALVGSFSGGTQILIAPTKILLGLIISSIICFPSLYIFSSLSGADLRPSFVLKSLMISIALIAVLLIGFAPIVWVFAQSSESLFFIGSIVILVWIIAFTFGAKALKKMLNLEYTEKQSHIQIWVGIFLLVTLQMSTSLRPIIGNEGPLLTSEKRFFLAHWIESAEGVENNND